MQPEKDQTELSPESSAIDEATKWLLERDLSDPVENLFTVADDHVETSLTEFESEVAGRPMFRGHGDGDDLSAILDEEILVTEVGSESDIYAKSSSQEETAAEPDGPMTVEHSSFHSVIDSTPDIDIADGADILSLAEEDDMGEHYLVLVKPASEPEPEPEPELELELESHTVLDYLASTPAPVDDAAFDDFLLGGRQLEHDDAFTEVLQVEHTEGVAAVDAQVEDTIDYHEDFKNLDGFQENTISVIASVIAQVMDEVTVSVKQRLLELTIDPELARVEVLLGNDVESIIECVTDGYAPIVEIRPDLPAALRQMGQNEVDAIYVRITLDDHAGNWNNLFRDDFIVPESSAAVVPPEIREESQPFAALDLDEFDFDFEESDPQQFDSYSAHNFGADLAPYSESTGNDPLSSIDFAAVVDVTGEQKSQEIYSENLAQEPAEANEKDLDNPEDMLPSSMENDSSWCIPEGIKFSAAEAGTTELLTEFLDIFIEEATGELEKLELAIENWETSGDPDIPVSVSHTLHTLKGIAKGVGLQIFGTLIHNYETLLEGLPSYNDEGDKAWYFRIVNAWLDASVQGFQAIENTRKDVTRALPTVVCMPVQNLESEINASAPQAPKDVPDADADAGGTQLAPSQESPSSPVLPSGDATTAKQTLPMDVDNKTVGAGSKNLVAQQSIRMTAEALDSLLNLTNQAQQLGVRSSESAVRSKLAAAESLARLSAVRAHIVKISDRALSNVTSKGSYSGSDLDALEMDQYSELQEAANILRESVEDLDDLIHHSSRQISMAEALLKQQASVISSLGSSIQEARVVSVSRLIPGLRRIVRTVAADLGKTVSLKVLNQVGTLDRDNHARCQVILEHMVRNALDHGIESPQQRVEVGKDASGSISIDVNKKGADYIITLSDDGRGIDPELMREAAYDRGLDVDVDALTDDEAMRLIFHKGFTTATSVSEISGRGVGMDIVLSELQQMGGDIQIESTVGEGTRFHIRIPPNVSVNGALLVSVSERSYAIPLDGLIAVDYVDVDDFFDAVSQDGRLSLFGVECEPAYLATICHGESLPERSAWPKSVPVLVAGSQERYMAIAVDDVKQALELVIRSLGVQFSAVPGVAGATTTADGQAVVALDLNALVMSVGSRGHSPLSLDQENPDQLLVLVVDDSRTQRMVLTIQFDTLGVETITAENGMVAIDLLNSAHRLPDVILLDVEMPVKDGIQTLREIRKSVRYSDIPVIMVTSRTGAKHRALADEAGCDGYMGKPFNFPVLVEQIGQLTGHMLQTS